MNTKRKTLKKVAGVSAVVALAPSSWTKPVLNSIVLPSHAQTSSGLVLSQIEDLTLLAGPLNNDPRVDFANDTLGGLAIYQLDLIRGSNISPDAVLSVIENPTSSRTDLGEISIASQSELLINWVFESGAAVVNGEYILVLRVTNPDGQSKDASAKVTIAR